MNSPMPSMIDQLKDVRSAARWLRASSSESRNRVLERLVTRMHENHPGILEANQRDLAELGSDATPAFRDRLTLNDTRLLQMEESLRQVRELPDPIGEITESHTLPNGLKASRVRSPLGVLFMIFESRPNVAIEAFSLALKSGNALILRGGKESRHTTAALYELIHQSLRDVSAPESCLFGITDPDRSLVKDLLSAKEWIDVVIPRGGDSLIQFVVENSRIPIIKNDRGLCHVYVHEDADPDMAIAIVENAKTQRPGVCNAMETLLVHERIAPSFLPALRGRLDRHGVRWRACARTREILPGLDAATDSDWDTEHLSLILNCRVVSSLDEAIHHIEEHGSRHSEAIVSRSADTARRFESEIDAAAVYWNASTRFTDGFELGLGGEIGISTQKLHARGPVGLRELTSIRWIIEGEGQIRV